MMLRNLISCTMQMPPACKTESVMDAVYGRWVRSSSKIKMNRGLFPISIAIWWYISRPHVHSNHRTISAFCPKEVGCSWEEGTRGESNREIMSSFSFRKACLSLVIIIIIIEQFAQTIESIIGAIEGYFSRLQDSPPCVRRPLSVRYLYLSRNRSSISFMWFLLYYLYGHSVSVRQQWTLSYEHTQRKTWE